jgi:hypothetical protein
MVIQDETRKTRRKRGSAPVKHGWVTAAFFASHHFLCSSFSATNRESRNDDVSIAGSEDERVWRGNDAAIVQRQRSFHSKDDGVK